MAKFKDDDLNDLIGNEEARGKSQMRPLNLDSLSQGDLDVPVKRTAAPSYSCLSLCCAYLSYCCDLAPRCCWCLGVLALLLPTYLLLVAVFFNPTEHFGLVNDFSTVSSSYDLTLGKIDHWCIKGDNDSCRCEDPLDPQPRAEFRAWSKAQSTNRELVTELVDAGSESPDIAFLGGSVIEEMNGKWFGQTKDDGLKGLQTLFQKNFQKDSGADLDAVALGIAGDTSSAILWRLMNGEMPPNFNPKIWWLEVGLNDLGRMQCSEEVVVLGVLRIVEEILAKKPDAKIVINSLFPLADLRGTMKVGENDYKDSFNKDLRQKGTKEIEKEKLKELKKKYGKKKAKEEAVGKTTHGDGAGVSAEVLDKIDKKKKDKEKKEKKEKKKQKKQDADDNNKKHRSMVIEPQSRQLRLFKRKDDKEVKLKAHKEKQKKFNPVTHKERKLPLWTAITAINSELKKFVSKQERVSFFDATDIFTDREDSDNYILRTDLVSVRGHPTRKGYEKWETAIITKAKTLLADPVVVPAPGPN